MPKPENRTALHLIPMETHHQKRWNPNPYRERFCCGRLNHKASGILQSDVAQRANTHQGNASVVLRKCGKYVSHTTISRSRMLFKNQKNLQKHLYWLVRADHPAFWKFARQPEQIPACLCAMLTGGAASASTDAHGADRLWASE